jgi:hypothetical protein
VDLKIARAGKHASKLDTFKYITLVVGCPARTVPRWPTHGVPGVTGGPVRGPDGAMVTIWVRYVGQDLPFGDRPADRAPVTWQELAAVRKVHTACVRRMPAGPARQFCSFVTEISARWYAVELALNVRQADTTGTRPAAIFRKAPLGPVGPCASRGDPRRAEQIGPRHTSTAGKPVPGDRP